jgi:hypothetical protein
LIVFEKGVAMKIAFLIVLAFSVLATADELQTGPTGIIIVQNYYYAKPGKAEEVYSWRIHASDVRQQFGLRRGRVLRRVSNSPQQPDVIWECEYPDAASREAEAKMLDKNPEFNEVMKHMNTLIDRFDRATYQVAGQNEPTH